MTQALIPEPQREFPGAPFDYERIEQAIQFLQAHFLEQPDLATVAAAVHLSEYHFQRLFTRWAGVSPKRFLQFLTLDYAKRQLAASKGVLTAALESGLSGPSRLHDLFVSVEAVTPGEFKTRGAGLRIQYGFHPTPFGTCLLGLTPRGICWLSFLDGTGHQAPLAALQARWRGAGLVEAPEATLEVATQIFPALGQRPARRLGVLLMGTNFQLKVWEALLRIPPGAVVSYGTLGGTIGAPAAARAIGSAVGQNAVAYLIPCHRVIRDSGVLGGYRWGERRKRVLLAWEAARKAEAETWGQKDKKENQRE